MKILGNLMLALIIGLLALISCSEKELEIEGLSPSVGARFINQDSLNKVTNAINAINADINVINNSIDSLEMLLNNGDQSDYSANFQSLDEMKAVLNSEKKALQTIRSSILAGEVLVQRIAGIGGVSELSFEDSLTDYSLPLNINAEVSEFLIVIDNREITIGFRYELDTLAKEETVVIEANNIKLLGFSGVDSVRFPCDTLNCKSYEANATIYF